MKKSDSLRYILAIMLAFLFILPFNIEVNADDTRPINQIQLDPRDTFVRDFNLEEGEAIYVRFRITYGPGVYFFIVDQDGKSEIDQTGDTDDTYEEGTYDANDGQWYYIPFEIPHRSTWYVWFSKARWAPHADYTATIEGHISHDTDGPIIENFDVPSGNLSGIVDVNYKVRDKGFPIKRVELLVDGNIVDYVDNPSQNHEFDVDEYGFCAEGILHWDTYPYQPGEHTIQLIANDSLNHGSHSEPISRNLIPVWWDYEQNLRIAYLIGFGIFIVAVIIIMMKRLS